MSRGAMYLVSAACLATTLGVVSCGDDDDTEADRLGVGAACDEPTDCDEEGQTCLTEFKGGYCGAKDCDADEDCPEGSACIQHSATATYCFRTCADKVDCNANRPVEEETNCSSSVTFVEGTKGRKACVPPSSG